MRAFRLLLVPVLAMVPMSGMLGGCSSSSESTADDADALIVAPDLDLARVSKMAPKKDAKQNLLRKSAPKATNLSLAPSPSMTYRGGPMLENVQVTSVFWGDGVPVANQKGLEGFYKAVIGKGSPYYAMLSEYDTTTPPQTIGFGTYAGSYVDHDAPAGAMVNDAQVRAELARLIDLGKLPPNDGHNIFMVYFPPGVAIDQGDGSLSCQAFCAYHDSFTRNGNQVFYGIMPDLSSGGCEQGCGFDATPLDNLYGVSTHELVEATTDAAVGDNNLAWYDDQNGEIGDICYMFPDAKVRGYNVQTEWSNQDRGCRAKPSKTNVTIDATPAEATVEAGGTAQFIVTAAGTMKSKATLKTMGLPKGLTATFDPPQIKPGQYSTMTVTAPAGTLASARSFFLYALDANGTYHYVQPQITVHGVAPAATSVDIAKGGSQGGDVVTITGTGFGRGATVSFGGIGGQVVGAGVGGVSVSVVTPSHVAGAVDVVVTNADGQSATLTKGFTFTAGAAPTITGVFPPVGTTAGGEFLRIDGANFGPDDQGSIPTVTIGGQPTQTYASANLIWALTPGGNAGPVDVVVTNGDGQSVTLAGGFTYATLVPPTVNPLAVATGAVAGGTYLTITGRGFDTAAKVTFDGKDATIATRNPRFLGLLTPAHPAGAVDVVVTNGNGTTTKLAGAYTYQ
jgi:hypothetical protein